MDCDPGDEIAIAVALYLSRRGDFDHSKDKAIVAKWERSQRNDRNRRKMIAIAKTDSLYFSLMILKAMQLIGWCDFEK